MWRRPAAPVSGTVRWRWLPGLLLCIVALVWVKAAAAESVTLNLKDADIGALIGTVSQITGKNFIVDPRVKGKVTVISSHPMSSDEVYQVFLSILQVHGFAAVRSGDVIKIVPDINAKQDAIPTATPGRPGEGDEMVTRVVQVTNVSAAQLVPILRPLVPQQGHLAAYPASNVLIISDRADNVERLVKIIHTIDSVKDNQIDVVPLKHASAADVVRILTALVHSEASQGKSPGGAGPSVIADERTNSVLIGGDKAERVRLRAIIAQLDSAQEQGGATHVIYLKYAKAKDLVPVLTGVSSSVAKGKKGQPQAQQNDISVQADESANALVITAPPDIYRSLKSVVEKLDVRLAQVLVEAVIAEISSDKAAELGIQWRSTSDISGSGVIGGTNFSTGTSINQVAQNPLNTGDGLSIGYFNGTSSIFGTNFLNVGALLRALAGDTSTNILSTPSLVTLDNQEAEIIVGQNVPIVTGSFTNTGAAQGSVNPFQTIQREDVGLTLKVKPQINEGNVIRLDIDQEVSSVVPSSVGSNQGITTNKRSIKTSVLVNDGQMIVLGGLIDDNLSQSVQKVPVLGDVPVLGNLFRYRKTTKNKRNLMVFLHPVILRGASGTTSITGKKYQYMRDRQLDLRHAQGGVSLMPHEQLPLLPKVDDFNHAPAMDVTPSTGAGAGNAAK
ncbi:MAG: type II secretion system secretin GspD [Gammaproteobacteria bacterium]